MLQVFFVATENRLPHLSSLGIMEIKGAFYIHYIKQNVKYLLTSAISKESAFGTYSCGL